MWNENSFTETFNLEYPIIQAGMAGGVTTAELVAAVSNAGGLGSIGAGYLSAEETRRIIRRVKALTDKPFAVNLFIIEDPEVDLDQITEAIDKLQPIYRALGIDRFPDVNPKDINKFDEQIEVIIEENVPVCSFTFGLPSKHTVDRLKEHGVRLIGTATTVKEAQLNEEVGMDAVVAQGSEAGGHRGTFDSEFSEAMIGTMALVPQVADNVNIPVIAAGGIADGRGIYASLILGASAAQLGTLFVTCHESGASAPIKSVILKGKETDTVITSAFSGKPARGVRNTFIDKMSEHHEIFAPYPIQHALTSIIRKEAAKQHRPEYLALWAGQNMRLNNELTASELIEKLITQINNLLE